jgi:hypothetical protein
MWLDDDQDDLYDFAAKFVLPLAAAVIMLVMVARRSPNPP